MSKKVIPAPKPKFTVHKNPNPVQQPTLPHGKPPSVMVAVPAMEMVHTEFAQHLCMLTASMVANGVQTTAAFNIGSVITIARRNLVDIFLKSGFDYILWLDSDMKFPIDAPLRLLSHNLPLVGCNYRRRRFPNPIFTAMNGSPGNYSEFKTTDDSPELEECDVLPQGLMLVKREVYEKIPQPFYIQEYIPEQDLEIGEDIYFCHKVKSAGIPIWCDHALSKQIAHIGVFHYNYNLSVPN